MRAAWTIIFLVVSSLALQGAKLSFVGLQSYSKKELIEAVGGRLDYIADREATSFRADDAAFLVETYLHDHGLPDASVSWSLPGGDIIQLTIQEGASKYLGEIIVNGAEDPEEIIEQFKAPFPETEDERAFIADEVEEAEERVRQLLHTRGYWKAQVKSVRGSRSADGRIPFVLNIDQGPLFSLTVPKVVSPVPISARASEKLQDVQGKTATAERIVKVRKTITRAYRRQGFNDISVMMTKEVNRTNELRLVFKVTPGQRYQVRSFKLEGLEKTKPSRVRDQFEDIVGEEFDEDQMNETIKELLATGAFSVVRLKSEEVSEPEVDLTLHLKEAKARGYSFSAGFGSLEGYILGARYFDRNFRGLLDNFNVGVELTSLGVLGEISLTDPFFLNRDLRFTTRAFLLSRDFDNYRKFESGLGAELLWDWGDHYSASVGASLTYNDITTSIPSELAGPSGYAVQRITFNQLYDRRDDPALPSDGWFAEWNNTLGFSFGSESVGFFETEGQFAYYKTLSERSSYQTSIRGGVIVPTGEQETFPIDLRQFLGGANTVRSFPERELGPDFDGDPLGGTAWWVANFEYVRGIRGPIKGVGFIDAGALDSETEIAVGVGVRIDLPVGPIRFEYGHSLTRDRGEPAGAFHFAIGTTF